jgi:hypothetical protein
MDTEQLKKIIEEHESRPNKDLIKVMDYINEEFEKTKKSLITTYNKILKEYQKRQNGAN